MRILADGATPVADWGAALDDYEAQLAAVGAALADVAAGRLDAAELAGWVGFTPPAGLPAAPAVHAERMRRLREETEHHRALAARLLAAVPVASPRRRLAAPSAGLVDRSI